MLTIWNIINYFRREEENNDWSVNLLTPPNHKIINRSAKRRWRNLLWELSASLTKDTVWFHYFLWGPLFWLSKLILNLMPSILSPSWSVRILRRNFSRKELKVSAEGYWLTRKLESRSRLNWIANSLAAVKKNTGEFSREVSLSTLWTYPASSFLARIRMLSSSTQVAHSNSYYK